MAIILSSRHIGGLWSGVTQRTVDVLRAQQAAYVAEHPATHDPVEILDEQFAYIGNGCWRIHCRCGEATHTDPEWKIACCFGCGAIWTRIVFPDDWQEIASLLSKRAIQGTRNWERPETLEELIAEQLAHGELV